MLAFIHHLLLVGQIPLDRIASLASKITTRNLILEWVPPTDPKFLELRPAAAKPSTPTSPNRTSAPHFTLTSM